MELQFRPVKEGRKVAAWVKALKDKSGVYLIAKRPAIVLTFFAPSVEYIGESHSGTLYKTLLRHFQRWKGPTAGPTFDPGEVHVAIVRTRPERAVELQDALIAEHLPKLNTVAKPKGFFG